MSRSRFAARFLDVVGQSPLEYLTQWRMYQAAGLLAEGSIALPALASSVGYSSEVSFGKAFKRWVGRTPADYRRSSSRKLQTS
jgi:AraC-like DNA-binding protein